MAVLNRPRKTLKASRKQEARVAGDYGGRVTPGSGNQWHAKGDVKAKRFLIECKTTEAASYRLDKATLTKIRIEAVKEGKHPALCIDIQGVEYFVIPGYVFKELTGENENDRTKNQEDAGGEASGEGD